ncbi:MAG: alanine racemase [Clostridiales bacterium]|nr:alanine racemase [Clostridiales bacterium]
MELLRSTQARVDLSAIAHNIQIARSRLRPETKLLAVVKAEAYGHGMVRVSQFIEQNGLADFLGVAIVEEGVTLRDEGIHLPILVMGVTDEAHLHAAALHDLAITVFDADTMTALQREAKAQGKRCSVHLKVDTGMNRIGAKGMAEFDRLLDLLARCPNLSFDGLFTHFAKSEESGGAFTEQQTETFSPFIAEAHARGYSPIVHAANSGAVFESPGAQYDMVRMGLSLYGYYPDTPRSAAFGLQPALSWHTSVVYVKIIAPGEGVSYGLKFVADRPTVIATLPVGYGDGYKRCLSGKSDVLIHGQRAPQVGNICMDQMMVDVTHIPDVRRGDDVVLLGSQGAETIGADELAQLAGTIPYEILLSISARTPRSYEP